MSTATHTKLFRPPNSHFLSFSLLDPDLQISTFCLCSHVVILLTCFSYSGTAEPFHSCFLLHSCTLPKLGLYPPSYSFKGCVCLTEQEQGGRGFCLPSCIRFLHTSALINAKIPLFLVELTFPRCDGLAA